MSKKPKILFVCTEDWFFRSHFLALNEAAVEGGYQTAIACSVGPARAELEEMGLKFWPVDVSRSSAGIFSALRYARQLAHAYRSEKPDIVHIFGLKPILVGGLLAMFFPKISKMYHVIGLGAIAEGAGFKAKIMRQVVFRLVAFMVSRKNSHLGVENPDDLEYLGRFGSIPADGVTLFGGAGIDTEVFQPLPAPRNAIPRIAFVGRMIWTKGVDVLVEAHQMLAAQGVQVQLDLYGNPDSGNPKTVTKQQMLEWGALPNVTWHGVTNDIESVWRQSDICVVSTRTREGMPRAMLEAAAYARPLVVTDVPGCRHFVRDGVEGFVAEPENAAALAKAMKKLAQSPDLQQKMGKAARARVLDGYTRENICTKVINIYCDLLARRNNKL